MKCEYIVNTGICAVSMYEFPLCFAVCLTHVLQMNRLTVTFDRQCVHERNQPILFHYVQNLSLTHII